MRRKRDLDSLDLPEGYTVRHRGKTQHLEIVKPDGEVLRMPSGIPVILSLTPGISRTRKIELARVRRAISYLDPPESYPALVEIDGKPVILEGPPE